MNCQVRVALAERNFAAVEGAFVRRGLRLRRRPGRSSRRRRGPRRTCPSRRRRGPGVSACGTAADRAIIIFFFFFFFVRLLGSVRIAPSAGVPHAETPGPRRRQLGQFHSTLNDVGYDGPVCVEVGGTAPTKAPSTAARFRSAQSPRVSPSIHRKVIRGVSQLNVAMIGLGFGAEFIPIYQAHPQANMYAICQRNDGEAEQGRRYASSIDDAVHRVRRRAEGSEGRFRAHQLADSRSRAGCRSRR